MVTVMVEVNVEEMGGTQRNRVVMAARAAVMAEVFCVEVISRTPRKRIMLASHSEVSV